MKPMHGPAKCATRISTSNEEKVGHCETRRTRRMTPYLADTNILINALNHRRGQRELLNQLVRQGHRLACCTVTLGELPVPGCSRTRAGADDLRLPGLLQPENALRPLEPTIASTSARRPSGRKT
jgi:hypothetical protein